MNFKEQVATESDNQNKYFPNCKEMRITFHVKTLKIALHVAWQ